MSASELRDLLHNYLDIATDKKIRAIYKMLEEDIEEAMVDESVTEMDRQMGAQHDTEKEFNDKTHRISRH